MKTSVLSLFLLTIVFHTFSQKPNIVFILTDDQGYGDLSCHGNPWIKTPNIDELYQSSARFTDYHVGTTCAPTRAGLLTGKYSNKVGVWHTIRGREFLKQGEATMAEIFRDAGYVTGIFGKWHLGDNYPFRPGDRGFDESLVHRGGGVSQTPDYWNNDYFDDTYFHNGKPEKYQGYCTDIWFAEGAKFIKKNNDRPFLCYIATNSPHDPTHVEEKFTAPYRNNPLIPNPAFYGMITAIDEKVGDLIRMLKAEGLYDNTIFIFMTDNGTAGGADLNDKKEVVRGYNAGMRGKKGSVYDGGHRTPFFLHWPAGGVNKGKDISSLTSYIDVLPTLMDLCGIKSGSKLHFDGISARMLFSGDSSGFKDRTIFTDTQRDEFLVHGKSAAVMTSEWRLVNGNELYEIHKDPAQAINVAAQYPEVVKDLTLSYEDWWKDVSKNADSYNRIIIGSEKEPLTCITSHDIHVNETGDPAWNQEMVRKGQGSNGFWALETSKAGRYEIELRRYPTESGLKLNDQAPPGQDVPGGKAFSAGVPIEFVDAVIKINDREYHQKARSGEAGVKFVLSLPSGPADLYTFMKDDKGTTRGAYYVYIHRVR